MSRPVVVSPEAQAQLEALHDRIAFTASTSTANRFIDAIIGQFERLQQFPYQGTMREDILPGLRTLGFRRRVSIAFVVEPQVVIVLGVFYGGQDFETLLHEP